jgi:hypothetical protein
MKENPKPRIITEEDQELLEMTSKLKLMLMVRMFNQQNSVFDIGLCASDPRINTANLEQRRKEGFTRAMIVFPNYSPLFLNPQYEHLRKKWLKEIGLNADQVVCFPSKSDGPRKEAIVLFR